jgi:hypothetical protein
MKEFYRGYTIVLVDGLFDVFDIFDIFDTRTEELIDDAPTLEDAKSKIDQWTEGSVR